MRKALARAESTEVERGASLKIGEVSKRSGIGIEALRFYERSGLLGRPARTASGYRVYKRAALDRLAFIKRAQTLGFTLDEIKQIIAERGSGKSPCAEVREIVRSRLEELDERMKEMRCYRKELGEALARWDEAGEIEGDICGLIEGTDIQLARSATRSIKRSKEKEVRKL